MSFMEKGSGNQREGGDGFLNCLGVSCRCIKEIQSKSSQNLSREVGKEAVWGSDSGDGR